LLENVAQKALPPALIISGNIWQHLAIFGNMEKDHRAGWEFSPDQKINVRQRSGGFCEFPAGCDRPNTAKVNHITGIYEARLDHKDRRAMSNPDLNAIMLCDTHEVQHDSQEEFQIECLLGEK